MIELPSQDGLTKIVLMPPGCRLVRKETLVEGWRREWDPPRRCVLIDDVKLWFAQNDPDDTRQVSELPDSVLLSLSDDLAFWFKVRWK